MKILIVDDEIAIAEALRETLMAEAHFVRLGHCGEDCLRLARAWRPDLILLDVMMPGKMTGLDALRLLRAESEVPVILITARSSDVDKVLGLEYADDYLVKPFSSAEMLARIRALMRRMGTRAPADAPTAICVGELRIDPEMHTATYAGRPLSLTPTEYNLLATLAGRPGRVFPRNELTERVWGPNTYLDPHTLDVHMASLRRKLEPEPARPRHLVTVRGVGFRYVAESDPG